MDDASARRRAATRRGDVVRADTERLANNTRLIDRFRGRLEYVLAQDTVTDRVIDLLDYIGEHPDKRDIESRSRFTQQNRSRNGAAAHHRTRKGQSVEDASAALERSSRVIKVGNDFFSGDADGRTEMYVEVYVKEAVTGTGMHGKHAKRPRPRVADPLEHPDNTERPGILRRGVAGVLGGTALGVAPVQHYGQDFATGIGIRVFQGPEADVLLHDAAGNRLQHFDEGALLPGTNEPALALAYDIDAELLDWVGRRDIACPGDNGFVPTPGRTDIPDGLERTVQFAGNVHLPYEEVLHGGPNPLTNIVDELGRMQRLGIARAVDIP